MFLSYTKYMQVHIFLFFNAHYILLYVQSSHGEVYRKEILS